MVRLPELAQLGINAIEIMPLGQFPEPQAQAITRATSSRWTTTTAGRMAFAPM